MRSNSVSTLEHNFQSLPQDAVVEGWNALTAVVSGALDRLQVWSLTQFYSVDFSQSGIGVNKCVFNKRTIKVCVSCC